MYAEYEYVENSQKSEILADLVAIFTGESDPSNLSDSCNKANTSIISTVPAGWTLHDAAASANSQVVKAPYVDDANSYKYVEIMLQSRLGLSGYESFDANSHTGVNKTSNNTTSSGYTQPYSNTQAGKFYLLSSARFLVILGEYATYRGDNSQGMIIAAEYSRTQPWNMSGFPSFAILLSGYGLGGQPMAYIVRAMDTLGNDVIGDSVYIASEGSSYNDWNSLDHFPQGTDTKVMDATKKRYVPFLPILLVKAKKYSVRLGDFSTISNVWVAPKSLLGQFETITEDGDEFIALQANASGHRFLFEKG
ncbi:MAG: hypothetical protein B6247_04055 [Candidatus Parabeggiatoa sp. nov. 2]|nr:MAG: hypothetical protein B6247_04055 [Beggiatoa sp. 4572_84]